MAKYNYKPITELKLAGWLMTKGFILHYCKRDDYNPKRIVYFFIAGDALQRAIETYNALNK